LKGVAVTAIVGEEKTKISVGVADPSSDKNVTRELMVLGPNNLPIEYDQWERDELVELVMYTDVKINVEITDSTFNL